MRISDAGGYVLGCFVALALLAGCGGSPSAVDGTSVALSTIARAADSHGAKSWMQPQTSSGSLLYITSGNEGVYVVSYPQGKLVGTLTGIDFPTGVCSDQHGNVFISAYYTEDVIEYAHGGTSPIAKLEDFGYYPFECAVDPTTGNLAVANGNSMQGTGGNVAIYSGAAGKPTFYTTLGVVDLWCAYDSAGDLFVGGFQGVYGYELAEMAAGSSSFTTINLSISSASANGEGMHWDGRYLAIVNPTAKVVYRVQISGSTGRVAGTVPFTGLIGELGDDFVIDGSQIVMPFAPKQDVSRVGLWKYPKGGKVGKEYRNDGIEFFSIALSP